MKFRARIVVVPRREILDPQGKAIRAALERSGYSGVSDVRAGKSFDVEIEARDAAAARPIFTSMAAKILSNSVVEDFAVEGIEEVRS